MGEVTSTTDVEVPKGRFSDARGVGGSRAGFAWLLYRVLRHRRANGQKLQTVDFVVGSLGAFCGLGYFYFLYRANTVTLQHSFDLIEQGGDAETSRRLNQRFKLAAGIALASGVVCMIASR